LCPRALSNEAARLRIQNLQNTETHEKKTEQSHATKQKPRRTSKTKKKGGVKKREDHPTKTFPNQWSTSQQRKNLNVVNKQNFIFLPITRVCLERNENAFFWFCFVVLTDHFQQLFGVFVIPRLLVVVDHAIGANLFQILFKRGQIRVLASLVLSLNVVQTDRILHNRQIAGSLVGIYRMKKGLQKATTSTQYDNNNKTSKRNLNVSISLENFERSQNLAVEGLFLVDSELLRIDGKLGLGKTTMNLKQKSEEHTHTHTHKQEK
jgi:hypothetical protein